MAESAHNDGSYPMAPLAPQSTLADRFLNSAHENLDFDADADYAFSSSFDTISPASLDMFHTSHDDNCLDKCVGAYNPQGLHRGGLAPPLVPRQHFATSSASLPFTYHSPGNNVFQAPPQQFSHMSPNMYQNIGLRYSFGHNINPNNGLTDYEYQLGNNFSASDLGMTSQGPVPDDCTSINCSQFSCSSCSTTHICRDDSCSVNGTPCDELNCPNNPSQSNEQVWNLQHDWSNHLPPEMMTQAHDQPCNHTNAEHDVAITLRDLSAPGALNTSLQQQPGAFHQFDCPMFGTGGDSVQHDRTLSLSLEPHPDIPARPTSPGNVSQGPSNLSERVCQWIVGRGETDTHDKTCGLTFNNSVELQQHLCDGHIASMSSKTKYVCLWKGCSRREDQVFASRNKLRRHISTHTFYKPFTCSHCNQGFSAQQALDQHIRTHTGEKPYHCDVEGCGKSFKQKSALTMHKRTHTGEKPLMCEICSKCFCESSNLSKHRKTHNPDFKYRCEEPGCDSRFIRVDQLRRHMATHGNKNMRQRRRHQRARSLASVVTSTNTSSSSETLQFPDQWNNDQLNNDGFNNDRFNNDLLNNNRFNNNRLNNDHFNMQG
ncbi:hypothetical protein F4809DRAFT_630802 [Biscogniauxia mediterranea]|nr:hypothetical protein F4809DRAFT_630802 [Biscogniauxia mediterranea]